MKATKSQNILNIRTFFWVTTFIFVFLMSRSAVNTTPSDNRASAAAITGEPNCSLRQTGDADCSGVINLVDFEIFRKEFIGILDTKQADFDSNGAVALADFEIWRKNYYTVTATGVPTTTPTIQVFTPTPSPMVTLSTTPTPTPTTIHIPTATPTISTTTFDQKIPQIFNFAAAQLQVTTQAVGSTAYPSSTNSTGSWNTSSASSWTSGFFPGSLWLMYEQTKDTTWKTYAEKWTAGIEGQKNDTSTHDLGFMLFNSFGQGYRLTNNANYKNVALTAARSLATRYSPTVGSIKSWDGGSTEYKVIIDNMMNLELLFWASKNGGDQSLYNMALSHALKTRENHIRPDGSSYHVVIYDPANGNVKSRVTAQGYSDSSAWSRGQAWAIYGFAIAYRETQDIRFLETARKTADYFIAHLPTDNVPYWDFQAPGIPNEPRDSSAASIAASGLLELSKLESDQTKKSLYRTKAKDMLESLASSSYLAQGTKYKSILIHGTQNKPKGNFDTGLIFGDYYFLEALIKYQKP